MKFVAEKIVEEARESLPELLQDKERYEEFLTTLESHHQLTRKLQSLEIQTIPIRRQLLRVYPDLALLESLLQKEHLDSEEQLMVLNLYASLIIAKTHLDDISTMKEEIEYMTTRLNRHEAY